MNIGAALCLDWAVTYSDGRIGRVLNAKPLVWIGLTSYSLYLWQQLFVNRLSNSAIASFPANIAVALAAATASYWLVERPALRLRKRAEAWATADAARTHASNADQPPESRRWLGLDGAIETER